MKKLIKRLLPRSILQPILLPYHWLRGVLAVVINSWPARGMKVIMVTGTNGKTTTVSFIASILEADGYKVGVSSTAFFKVGKDYELNQENMTVTNPFDLQKLLKRMKKAKLDWVVLEVTSHALQQHRVLGIPKQAALMTNLTQDHLDYHGDMNHYAMAKAKMFKGKPPLIVLNYDDEWYSVFNEFKAKNRKLSYGTDRQADARITKAKLSKTGSKLTMSLDGERVDANVKLIGKFNAYNALAAATTAHGLGIDVKVIKHGLENLAAVPGRMEPIENDRGLNIFVDYAHTPDALKNSLETLRELNQGRRVITVFGATGDRDKDKRPLMGRVVAELAQLAIVTDDEPYTENPLRIREAVMEGAQAVENGAEVLEVGDRRGAIHKALQLARRGDIIYVTGMGHQSFRKIGDEKEPWNDREVIIELLNKK